MKFLLKIESAVLFSNAFVSTQEHFALLPFYKFYGG